jgi:hypothetical protein
MGLDMYLYREIFIGAEWEHRNVTGVIDIKVGDKPVIINFNKVSTITEKVMYWRKANAIHRWFVDNVQDGKDECQRSYVTEDQLLELVDICKKVLADNSLAIELLPPQEGFFFGGTAIDEYYFADLKQTIEGIKAINLDDNGDLYYESSW